MRDTYRAPFRHRGELCLENAKTTKGQGKGYLTAVLYFSPERSAGLQKNMCPFSSPGCRASCLHYAGRAAVYAPIHDARARKTAEYLADPARYIAGLEMEVWRLEKRAAEHGFRLAVRTGGTHEDDRIAPALAPLFPKVKFYNYKKRPRAWEQELKNYRITMSRSETNEKHCLEALDNGINVAALIDIPKAAPIPARYWGFRTIDGDAHDLRFLDARPRVVILRAKGLARLDNTGFVDRAFSA